MLSFSSVAACESFCFITIVVFVAEKFFLASRHTNRQFLFCRFLFQRGNEVLLLSFYLSSSICSASRNTNTRPNKKLSPNWTQTYRVKCFMVIFSQLTSPDTFFFSPFFCTPLTDETIFYSSSFFSAFSPLLRNIKWNEKKSCLLDIIFCVRKKWEERH